MNSLMKLIIWVVIIYLSIGAIIFVLGGFKDPLDILVWAKEAYERYLI